MKKEDTEMMLRIFETERRRYAIFIRVMGSGKRTISRPRQKISQIISATTCFEAEKIVITDMCDRLILDTAGYFINSCQQSGIL